MTPIHDLTGKTFGRLTVLRMSRLADGTLDKTRNGQIRWIVTCSCGSGERVVVGWAMVTGTIKSCGCSRKRSATAGQS